MVLRGLTLRWDLAPWVLRSGARRFIAGEQLLMTVANGSGVVIDAAAALRSKAVSRSEPRELWRSLAVRYSGRCNFLSSDVQRGSLCSPSSVRSAKIWKTLLSFAATALPYHAKPWFASPNHA